MRRQHVQLHLHFYARVIIGGFVRDRTRFVIDDPHVFVRFVHAVNLAEKCVRGHFLLNSFYLKRRIFQLTEHRHGNRFRFFTERFRRVFARIGISSRRVHGLLRFFFRVFPCVRADVCFRFKARHIFSDFFQDRVDKIPAVETHHDGFFPFFQFQAVGHKIPKRTGKIFFQLRRRDLPFTEKQIFPARDVIERFFFRHRAFRVQAQLRQRRVQRVKTLRLRLISFFFSALVSRPFLVPHFHQKPPNGRRFRRTDIFKLCIFKLRVLFRHDRFAFRRRKRAANIPKRFRQRGFFPLFAQGIGNVQIIGKSAEI